MISAKEIKNTIQKLPISKMPGPDKIPNKTIKAALKELTTLFTNTVTVCL